MNTRLFLSFAVITLLITSCSKSVVAPYKLTIADYIPTKPGTSWKYAYALSGYITYAPTDTLTITMTSDTLNRFGQKFAVASASTYGFTGTNTFYFHKSANPTTSNTTLYTTIVHDTQSGYDFNLPILLDRKTNFGDTSYYVPNTNPSLPPPFQLIGWADNALRDQVIQGKTYKNCIECGANIAKLYDGDDPTLKGVYIYYGFYRFILAPNIGIVQEYTNTQVIWMLRADVKQ